MAVAIDTNVLIRYVTNDEPTKADRAKQFLERIERGEEECILCEAVIAEVIWVLTHPRIYNLSREEVVEYLVSVVQLNGVRIQPKTMYLRALEMYKTSDLDFTDCLLASMVECGRAASLASFDSEIRQYFPVELTKL